jgi:hypothetical protein
MNMRNSEHYPDTTAQTAIYAVQREQDAADQRLTRLVRALKEMLDLADYELVERIVLRDRRSGRVYR